MCLDPDAVGLGHLDGAVHDHRIAAVARETLAEEITLRISSSLPIV